MDRTLMDRTLMDRTLMCGSRSTGQQRSASHSVDVTSLGCNFLRLFVY
jgi:hypothetical protein